MTTDSYDLATLSAAAGVSPRTVRYYIQQGLLPAPDSRGPGAHYGLGHLVRLHAIRRLQREHLPLAEIRRRLDALDPAALRELSREPGGVLRENARDYIRAALSGPPATLDAVDSVAASVPTSSMVRSEFPDPWDFSSKPPSGSRSQWDRITLAPDVELHVRRPLSREGNRQVERLLDAARHIFEEDVP